MQNKVQQIMELLFFFSSDIMNKKLMYTIIINHFQRNAMKHDMRDNILLSAKYASKEVSYCLQYMPQEKTLAFKSCLQRNTPSFFKSSLQRKNPCLQYMPLEKTPFFLEIKHLQKTSFCLQNMPLKYLNRCVSNVKKDNYKSTNTQQVTINIE